MSKLHEALRKAALTADHAEIACQGNPRKLQEWLRNACLHRCEQAAETGSEAERLLAVGLWLRLLDAGVLLTDTKCLWTLENYFTRKQ